MADLIPTDGEAAWLEARRKGVTASEIAVIMGLSPYSSPYALYHQKLGILPGEPDSPEKRFGRFIEEYVAGEFAAAHPEFAVLGDGRSLYASSERPWMMATPDREVGEVVDTDSCTCGAGPMGYYGMHERHCGLELNGRVAVLECKTDGGSDEWGEPGTDEVPVHYRAQAIWQMDVMGVSTAYVACLRMMQRDVREYVIAHAEGCGPGRNMLAYPSLACPVCGDLVLMLEAARDFLDRVDRKEAPDVDWRPATIGALKQLHPSVADEDVLVGGQLAKRYRAALKNAKHWEQRKKLYEAQLRQQMGSARRAFVPGEHADSPREVIARRDVYEVREHVRKASTVDKLVPVYPKTKKES